MGSGTLVARALLAASGTGEPAEAAAARRLAATHGLAVRHVEQAGATWAWSATARALP